jgi:hypothetical protein
MFVEGRKDDKIAATSTTKKGHSKAKYSNSDSSSSTCTYIGKKSIRRSTGCYDRSYGYKFSSSTSSRKSSASEYSPFPVRKSQKKKKVQSKGKLSSAAKSKARTSEFCSYDIYVIIIYHLCCKGSWSVN